jgi:hypothetical protein
LKRTKKNVIDYFNIIILGTPWVEINENGKIERGYIFEGKKYKSPDLVKNIQEKK